MKSSFKIGFAQISLAAQKNLSCPNLGGGGCCPPAPHGLYAYVKVNKKQNLINDRTKCKFNSVLTLRLDSIKIICSLSNKWSACT